LSENTGFRLVYLKNEEVKAVGGFRIAEWLAGGKYLEIEDLVTKDGERSKGFGGAIFDWLVALAKRENCDQIRLVSHVKRFGAHRFYLQKGMIIEAHYFSMSLK
jgi:GNAT superfamily N-acetyltransferase